MDVAVESVVTVVITADVRVVRARKVPPQESSLLNCKFQTSSSMLYWSILTLFLTAVVDLDVDVVVPQHRRSILHFSYACSMHPTEIPHKHLYGWTTGQ